MTTATTTDVTSYLVQLCDRAFAAFCEDMGGMFDVDMQCERRQVGWGPIRTLQEHCRKLTTIHWVKAQGTLNGTFPLVFDQGGVFILGGVIVMLPEPRILEGLKRGTLKDTESLEDATREAGNLLVGSWDRVFRTDCPGHKHFLKTDTFIGKPWEGGDASKATPANTGPAELQSPEQVLIVRYEMTVESYPSFLCTAVFPQSVLAGLGTGEPESPEAGGGRPGTSGKQASGITDHKFEAGDAERRSSTADSLLDENTGGRRPQAADVYRLPPTASGLPGESPVAVTSTIIGNQEPRSSSAALAELLGLTADRLMDRDVIWADPEDSVQEVIARMQQHNVGYVLVGRKGVLEGLVSSSNILGAVSLYLRPMFAKWRRPQDEATLGVKVKWIMSRPVRTVRPDAGLPVLIETMRRCGGRCLVVVDVQGAVQGLVTVFDILLRVLGAGQDFTWQGRPPQAPALLL